MAKKDWATKLKLYRFSLVMIITLIVLCFQNCTSTHDIAKISLALRSSKSSSLQPNPTASPSNSPPPPSPSPTATPAGGNNYFTWGVETDYTSYFSGPVSYFPGTTRDCSTGAAHAGNCSMKLDVMGVDRYPSGNTQMGADLILTKTLPFNIVGGPALYYRWWMKIESDFSWGTAAYGGARTKSNRVLGGIPDPVHGASYSRGYTGYIAQNGFLIGECDASYDSNGVRYIGGGCTDAQGNPSTSDTSLLIPHNMDTMADGQWHEYVVMVKGNTTTGSSDAQFKVWIDNQLIGTLNNWHMHDVGNNPHVEAWGGWMVSPYFQLRSTPADGGVIHVDDFSTDDFYNSQLQ